MESDDLKVLIGEEDRASRTILEKDYGSYG